MGADVHSRFDARRYAEGLGVFILGPEELDLTPSALHQLTVMDSSSWSGMTVRTKAATGIVVNTSHSPERIASTIAHELAHIELRHTPSNVSLSQSGKILLISEYTKELEEEADWLAGAILLPRDGLLRSRANGASTEAICRHFGVSRDLCAWRLRMTGVDLQLRRRET